ncbi:MAG: 16S rRNA (guanine(966)-N(2))-methyltransferase RsmD [Oceanococcus sp.]
MSKPGQLRLIAGHWRGRVLPVAELPELRPTPNRVRETLFNWLAPDIEGIRVLDMFAGTGALGFEALSRGAGHVTLLESHPAAIRQLQASARTLDVSAERIDIHSGDAFANLARLGQFDLVFLDPPFPADLWHQALAALPPHLAPGHRVYLESPRNWAPPTDNGWQVRKEKKAADVAFRLLDYSAPSIVT